MVVGPEFVDCASGGAVLSDDADEDRVVDEEAAGTTRVPEILFPDPDNDDPVEGLLMKLPFPSAFAVPDVVKIVVSVLDEAVLDVRLEGETEPLDSVEISTRDDAPVPSLPSVPDTVDGAMTTVPVPEGTEAVPVP